MKVEILFSNTRVKVYSLIWVILLILNKQLPMTKSSRTKFETVIVNVCVFFVQAFFWNIFFAFTSRISFSTLTFDCCVTYISLIPKLSLSLKQINFNIRDEEAIIVEWLKSQSGNVEARFTPLLGRKSLHG